MPLTLILSFVSLLQLASPNMANGRSILSKFEESFVYNGVYFAALVAKRSTPTTAKVWRASDGLLVLEVTAHGESVIKVELSPNRSAVLTSSYMRLGESTVVSGRVSRDNSIRLTDLKSGKEIYRIKNATYGTFSRDGQRVFGFIVRGNTPVTRYWNLAAWDARTGRRLYTSQALRNSPDESLSFEESASGQKLLLVDGNFISIMNSKSGKKILNIDAGHLGYARPFLAPDGSFVVLPTEEALKTYALPSGKEVKSTPLPLRSLAWKIAWYVGEDGFAAAEEGIVVSRSAGKVFELQTKLELIESVLASEVKDRFVVNWSARNRNGTARRMVTAFSKSSCKLLWEKEGRIVSLWRGFGVYLQDNILSLISLEDGSTVRSITLEDYPR